MGVNSTLRKLNTYELNMLLNLHDLLDLTFRIYKNDYLRNAENHDPTPLNLSNYSQAEP